MIRHTAIVVNVLLLLYNISSAQGRKDSTIVLQSVTITQSQLRTFVVEPNYLLLDSSTLSLSRTGTLADLFRKQGYGHIRSYGPGGLTAPAFRGSGSSHTSVLWNGINIGSPLNGQNDMSLIPMSIFQTASLQSGGNSSLSGSGAIGGYINLDNTVNFQRGISASSSIAMGSFGTRFIDASVTAGSERIAGSVHAVSSISDNNYKYLNSDKIPATLQRREHSKFEMHSLLSQVQARLTHRDAISIRSWIQNSTYLIPNPTSFTYPGEADESNEIGRYMFEWKHNASSMTIHTSTALLTQRLLYNDRAKFEVSNNTFNSFVQNLEVNGQINPTIQMIGGAHYNLETSRVDQFGTDNPKRNRIAFFYGAKFEHSWRYNFAFTLREELVDGNTTPIAPSVSGLFRIDSSFHLSAKATRNYRLPTLNDLYWLGGGTKGNPDLKPEVGWSEEISATYRRGNFDSRITAFNSIIDDWIIWNPSGSYSYSPQNIKKVWSRGIEFQGTYHRSFGRASLHTIARYSMSVSTNKRIYSNGNPNEIDKQLILTPRDEFSLLGELTFNGFALRVDGSYTGRQFNDTDNSPYNIVPAYFITNAWASKNFELHRFSVVLMFEVGNIFNINYVARPGYPNPGSNFKIALTLNFNNYKHG
ncbi:MAG: TonB-dependent receptor [Chryseolinea sp.]